MADRLKLDDLQSYGGAFPNTSLPANQEQRQSARALLAIDAILVMDGDKLDVKTVDISAGGLCIGATKQLGVGKECQLSFELPLAGEMHPILAQASVIYCFYTGEQGFKVGLEFLNLTPACIDKIKQLIDA